MSGEKASEVKTLVLEAVEAANRVADREVSHPFHYTQGKVEAIDAIEAATVGLEGHEAFLTGTIIRYLWRWRKKGRPLQDLEKATWYLERLKAQVKP